MTAKPAAERTGSPRVEELVKTAQKKLRPNQLPPALALRRYAALLVAAERYALAHEILATDAFSTVPQVYQEEYGIGAHADSATARKVLGNSRQKMQQMGEKFHSAAHTFWDAISFYKEHESSLPASLKTRYPLSLLRQWNFDLHEVAELLCPKSLKLNPKPLPQEPAPKPLKKEHACFLWWAHFMRYEARWSHMANLAHVWHLTDIKDKKSEGKSPTSLERHVERLRQQHSRIPEPSSFMPADDRRLFLKG
jgi:hypothetical protein